MQVEVAKFSLESELKVPEIAAQVSLHGATRFLHAGDINQLRSLVILGSDQKPGRVFALL